MTIKLNSQQLKLVLRQAKEKLQRQKMTFKVSESPYQDPMPPEGLFTYDFYIPPHGNGLASMKGTILKAEWEKDYKGQYVATKNTEKIIKELQSMADDNDKDSYERMMTETQIISTPIAEEKEDDVADSEIGDSVYLKGDKILIWVDVVSEEDGEVKFDEGSVKVEDIKEFEQTEENAAKVRAIQEAKAKEDAMKEIIALAKDKGVDFGMLADRLLEEE